MTFKKWMIFMTLGLLLLPVFGQDEEEECDMEEDTRVYSSHFRTDDCKFRTRYFSFEQKHQYWIMEPGWQVVLEGEDEDEFVRVEITVLDETEVVAGVNTRVVEEREFKDGELYEVSRNWFAICVRTNDIYYFGEEVDFYEDGELVSHAGAWRVGENGAGPGVLLPGTALVGARFHQENSIDIAEDRGEILDIGEYSVGDVTYQNVLVLKEDSPLDDPCDYSLKYFAPGIGMIKDEELEIVEAGFIFRVNSYWPFKD